MASLEMTVSRNTSNNPPAAPLCRMTRVGSVLACIAAVAACALAVRVHEFNDPTLDKGRRSEDKDCVNSGDTAWMLCATTFVMLQTPACGILQAGLVRRKNALSVIGQAVMGVPVGSILWYVLGFSLTFGESSGGFIGSPWTHFFWRGVQYDECFPDQNIPKTMYASYQMMFALMVPVIVTGAWAEKFSLQAYFMFIVIWPFLVYYPVAHWVWNSDGFLMKWNVQDFAGGLTIHATSGAAATVVAMTQERRKDFDAVDGNTAHNMPLFILGAALVWAGWYSFNAGSALHANDQASSALANTQISSCASCIVWCAISWALDGVVPTGAMVSGALAGLAGITPASGYVVHQSALFIGTTVGVFSCIGARQMKKQLQLDDVLDVCSLQAIPGVIGAVLIGFLGEKSSGSQLDGLLFGGDATLLKAQCVAAVLIIAWSVFWTYILMKVIRHTVGTNVDYITEHLGLDYKYHGEIAYDSVMDVQEWQREEQLHYFISQALEAAASGGSNGISEFKKLAATGHDLTLADYDGRTVFHVAAAENNIEVLEYLFGLHGMESYKNVLDHFGNTPLTDAMTNGPEIHAVANQHLTQEQIEARGTQTVEFLRGLGCHAYPIVGLFRLMVFVKSNDLVGVRAQCDKAISLASQADYDNRTPLHVAVDAGGDLLVVAELLQQGATPDVPDRWSKTALEYALEKLVRMQQEQLTSHDPAAAETVSHYKDLVSLLERPDMRDSEIQRMPSQNPTDADASAEALPSGVHPKIQLQSVAHQIHTSKVPALARGLDPELTMRETLKVLGHHGVVASPSEDYDVVLFRETEQQDAVMCDLNKSLKESHITSDTVIELRMSAGREKHVKTRERLRTDIMYYSAEHNARELKRIFLTGASVVVADYDKRSTLHLACAAQNETKHRKIDTVVFLLKRYNEFRRSSPRIFPAGIEESNVLGSVNFLDRFGQSALDEAVRAGELPTIDLLLSAGATIDYTKLGMQLCKAAAVGDLKTLQALHQTFKSSEYDLSTADWDARTALHLAVEGPVDHSGSGIAHQEKRLECVKWLIDHHANPHVPDFMGKSPLDCATSGSNIIKALRAQPEHHSESVPSPRSSGGMRHWFKGNQTSQALAATATPLLCARNHEMGPYPSDYDSIHDVNPAA